MDVKYKLVVFGAGYVGLVTGVCFAEMGINVCCIDNNVQKIEKIKKGHIPIFEPKLPEIIENNVYAKRLAFSSEPLNYLQNAEYIIIAVGTPTATDGSVDVTGVYNIAELLAENINSDKVIVIKSTVPVGTADTVEKIILKALERRNLANLKIDIVSNPEFLKEGSAVDDCLKPNRIIIGVNSSEALKKMEFLYHPFSRLGYKILTMSRRSSELTKYAANAMLAVRISFMNEMSQLCENVGADIEDIRHGIGLDNRIGKHFLYAGLGFGGSCFPKDTLGLINMGMQNNIEMRIVNSAVSVNKLQRDFFLNKIINYFNNNLNELTVTVLGLSFKPNTDDIRFSPGLYIANKLSELTKNVHVYDPIVTTVEQNILLLKDELNEKIKIFSNILDSLMHSSAIILCTEWNEFRMLNFEEIKKIMNHSVIFDGRNQYSKDLVKTYGFTYFGIGRD